MHLTCDYINKIYPEKFENIFRVNVGHCVRAQLHAESVDYEYVPLAWAYVVFVALAIRSLDSTQVTSVQQMLVNIKQILKDVNVLMYDWTLRSRLWRRSLRS